MPKKQQLAVANILLAEWYLESEILVLYGVSSDLKYEQYLKDFINTHTPYRYINAEQFGEVIWSTSNIKVEQFGTCVLDHDGERMATAYEHSNGTVYCYYYDALLDYLETDSSRIIDFLKEVTLIQPDDRITTWGLMKMLIAHPQFVYTKKEKRA